jgi:hypothetical protein
MFFVCAGAVKTDHEKKMVDGRGDAQQYVVQPGK